jgi:hypothetical protein
VADLSYVKALTRGITDEKTRSVLDQIFTHILSNIRIGVPEHQTRAVNLQCYFEASTTASDTGVFTIAHGLPSPPHYAIPILELDQVGSKAGFLTVAQAADSKRIYLRADAGSTNVPVMLLVEW